MAVATQRARRLSQAHGLPLAHHVATALCHFAEADEETPQGPLITPCVNATLYRPVE
jgi:hypothetical protein